MCIEIDTNVQRDTQPWEATMMDETKILHPGVHVQGGLMIANFVQDTASTGDIGKVGEIQMSPTRAHVGSTQYIVQLVYTTSRCVYHNPTTLPNFC